MPFRVGRDVPQCDEHRAARAPSVRLRLRLIAIFIHALVIFVVSRIALPLARPHNLRHGALRKHGGRGTQEAEQQLLVRADVAVLVREAPALSHGSSTSTSPHPCTHTKHSPACG
jgi:hypothetical protein